MQTVDLSTERPDVLVVGAGNAALCAAISAHESGARVLMLEAAPFEERGGNSHFTGGAFHNYASGTGLMSGATFGRLAGKSAAQFALAQVSRGLAVRA